MAFVLIGLALALAAGAFLMLRKPASRKTLPDQAEAPSHARVDSPSSPASRERSLDIARAGPVRERSVPPELASFTLVNSNDLAGDRKQQFVRTFRNVPRPPRLLHHLLSADFVSSASSAELEDLIVSEPLIAARVLATVNSPMFGLKTQVRSIRQAVTYLGLNAVRSVCLRYILIASFKTDSAERKEILSGTWKASALASELIQRLSQKLSLPDPGALVSAVVLSFLGRLATAATIAQPVLASIPARDLLLRTRAEQSALGLSASEIGRILMSDWELPKHLVAEAADIDWVMVTPANLAAATDPAKRAREALCYLSARLGEQLAHGNLEDLSSFDLSSDESVEFFHLRGYLEDSHVARVGEVLRSAELNGAVRKMLTSMREPQTVG